MTDKEQKKWYEEKWGKNEEPGETPTERPHCDNDSLKNQDKEQIIIDGEKYNKCNGCKLWDGYICTGDRSYEPNAEAHRAICNEHMAKEFWKVYHELFYKTQECEELKKQLMQKDEVNTFFNTPIEGWSSNPCDICESKNNYEQLTQECEELKETLNKLTRGVVMPVSEPEVIDLTDRYRKALEEIEEYIKKYECDNCEDFVFGCGDCGTPRDILDIISKAKERENE